MSDKTNLQNPHDSSEQESQFDENAIRLKDRSGRRSFMRQGAAIVGAVGLASSTSTAFADDCDRGSRENKNASLPGTDADAGASADPSGLSLRLWFDILRIVKWLIPNRLNTNFVLFAKVFNKQF